MALALSRIVLLAALLGATAAEAGSKWIYVQRHDDGVTSFTDQKPANGAYKRIYAGGRATAGASCLGLNEEAMKARANTYSPLITKYARTHGLSPQLVSAVMRVESCYDRQAVSRVGARGLMQLMPGTATQLGVKDSFDPEQNIEGGVRYLAAMMNRFGNNIAYALAAYNAGPEAVTTFNGIPPFPETRKYVDRILRLYKPTT